MNPERNKCKDYIKIDYYDVDGIPIGGDKQETPIALVPGEIRSMTFYKVTGAQSYRVWVTK